jgi:hypothetical protein
MNRIGNLEDNRHARTCHFGSRRSLFRRPQIPCHTPNSAGQHGETPCTARDFVNTPYFLPLPVRELARQLLINSIGLAASFQRSAGAKHARIS